MDSNDNDEKGNHKYKKATEKPLVETVQEDARDTRGPKDDKNTMGDAPGWVDDLFLGVSSASSDTTDNLHAKPQPPPMPMNNSNHPTSHRRTPSSVLRSELPPGIPKPSHKRNVSWGLENNIIQVDIDNTVIHPEPDSSNNIMNNNVDPSANLNIQNLPYFHARKNSAGRISVEDLRSIRPMENEAEHYLIQAMEARDPLVPVEGTKGGDEYSSTAAVLSNILPEDLDALRVEEPTADGASVGSNGSNRGSIDNMGIGSQSSSSRSLFQPNKSTRQNKPTRGPSHMRHRRMETVGEKLESLATAMDVLHFQNLDFVLEEENFSDSMLPCALQEDKLDTNEHWTAADALQQNADILFTRHRTQTEEQLDEEIAQTTALLSPVTAESDSGSTQTAASRWKLLKHAITVSRMHPTSPGNGISTSGGVANNLSEVQDESKRIVDVEDPSNATSPSEKETKKPRSSRQLINRSAVNKTSSFKMGESNNKFLAELKDFFAPRRQSIFFFLRTTVLYIILPCICIAAILFYFADNPPTGKLDAHSNATSEGGKQVNSKGESIDPKTASTSWWLLFIGVRQVVTFVTAKAVELFFIDFLSVRSRFSVKILGPWGTLFILQSKGWPFQLFVWGLLNIALLSGAKPFFRHWAYWQDAIDLFNESNPAGEVVDSEWYHRVVAIAVSLGIIVAVKRFWLGLYLGRQTFSQYSDKLANVMKKILLVSEVSSLGRIFERQARESDVNEQRRSTITAETFGLNKERFEVLMSALPDDSTLGGYAPSEPGAEETRRVIDPDDRHPLTGSLTQNQKSRITQLLGQWEEPNVSDSKTQNRVSVSELLQFRRALEFLNTTYPFSGSFGLADRRETTVASSQEVYDRLLLRSPDPFIVQFDVIALLGVTKDGSLDHDKLKDLIKLFRPDRDGSIDCIDFVKSIDTVYKELRLLRASVANSSKIDRAFESIFNVIFYAIVICIILSQIGYDPLSLFLSISGVILGFAFMIGSASSKYFEGLLFILVRRPFQIGDGIALSNVNETTPATGSAFWIVEDVDLFTTKVIYYFSGERATLNNGSLANSRVINSTLSTNAWLYVYLKFPVSVSFEKLQIFQQALDHFFKNRPREWMSFTQFRATRVEADQGFIEYIVLGQHRLPWVQYHELHQSKADLMHFSMELAKKLDIWYHSPPVPVDLSFVVANPSEVVNRVSEVQQPPATISATGNAGPDLTSLHDQFRPQLDWQR